MSKSGISEKTGVAAHRECWRWCREKSRAGGAWAHWVSLTGKFRMLT
jgi:hypothetical protein